MLNKLYLAVITSSLLFAISCGLRFPEVDVVVVAIPAEGGTVSPAEGIFPTDVPITFEATPAEGWIFYSWENIFPWVEYDKPIIEITFSHYTRIDGVARFIQPPVFADTEVVEVTNPETGRTWMDRNLGASRAATSSDDLEAMGYLFQWGRRADGHQVWNSPTTRFISSYDEPGHGEFIRGASNWQFQVNEDLWQGVDGVNNPCPPGFRIPTADEWREELRTWPNSNRGSRRAFESVLKLPQSPERNRSDGQVIRIGRSGGKYWSSNLVRVNFGDAPPTELVNTLIFNDSSWLSGQSSARIWSVNQATGLPVRCIKHQGEDPHN